MKKNLVYTVFYLSSSCMYAQGIGSEIIPVEQHVSYYLNGQDYPQGAYLKDVNHLFDKYVGTWVGSQNGYNYQFVIVNYLRNFHNGDLFADELHLRYKVTNANGDIIVNTLSQQAGSALTVVGLFLDPAQEVYTFDYVGLNSACGQGGYIHIRSFGSGNALSLHFVPSIFWPEQCPSGPVPQVIPLSIELMRQ